MNLTDLKQIAGWRLGDRDDMEPRIAAELPVLQETVLEGNPWLPWFLLSTWDGATVSSTQTVALPADFLMESEESALYIQDTSGAWHELGKEAPDVLRRKYSGEGIPQGYAILGNSIYFYPTPDQAYPLCLDKYFAKADPIATLSPVSVWLDEASDVVLAELCQVLAAKHLKDANAAAGFAADASKAWARLYNKHIAREEINTVRIMGGNT